MPAPRGWEWFDELPEEWEPPEELLSPSNSPEHNLAILMLSCDVLGRDVCALIGRFITEQSLFTLWFLRDVKRSGRDLKEAALISGIGHHWTRQVYEAWMRFYSSTKTEGPNEGVRTLIVEARAELAKALQNAVDALAAVRTDVPPLA